MTDHRWRFRFQGFVVGLLLLGVAAAATARKHGQQLLHEREQRQAAEALGLTLGTEVSGLRLLAADRDRLEAELGSVRGQLSEQVRLTERFRAQGRAPAATVYVDREVRLPGEPVLVPCDPGASCEVSGQWVACSCEGERLDVGGKPAVRIAWKGQAGASVAGHEVTWDSGETPQPAEVVSYEVAPVQPGPRWSRRLWVGLEAGQGFGPSVAWSIEGRRWAVLLGAAATVDHEAQLSGSTDYLAYSSGLEVTPSLSVLVSRRR